MTEDHMGMDHPYVMARMQSGIDALFLRAEGVCLGEALATTVPRMRELFGDDIPREIVEVAVTLAYCGVHDT